MKRIVPVIVLCSCIISASVIYARTGGTARTSLVRTRLTRDITQAVLVARNIDILAVYRDGRVDVAVTDEQLDWLLSKGIVVSVLERSGLGAPTGLDANLGMYHTYMEMETMLAFLATTYPELARLDTLGSSIEGRSIPVIKISDNADADEDEPEVFIMGCHHARELMSVEVPLLLAQYLLSGYGTDPEVTGLVNEREIWIAPMVNPDGHVYVQNHHDGDWWTWWRKNRRNNGDGSFGVDLNRNYGYRWGYDNVGSSPTPSSDVYRGTAPFSEPETRAVRDFCAGREIVLALSYHSYGELILFPWGYAPVYTGDHEWYLTMADSLKRGNGYTAGCSAMGTLYRTNGDTDDWAYGDTLIKNRFFCYTIELNSYEEGGFAPAESLIQPTFEKVLDANLTLIRRADEPLGVLGPRQPHLSDIAYSPTPTFKLSWSAGEPSDPNPPRSYTVVEYKNLQGVSDTCEQGDTLWALRGFSISSARSSAGGYSFYSGYGPDLYSTLSMVTVYPRSLGDTLSCWLWYDIEANWDYAYLEVSTDEGIIWRTVPGSVTTNYDPNSKNRGNGITGSSSGWENAEFYFDQVGGITENDALIVRFAYMTDSYIQYEGMYVDLVSPTASCDGKEVIAEQHPYPFYYRHPGETGDFAYFVRAVDGEGHASRMSNIVFHGVSVLTPAGAPAFRTVLSQNRPNPFNPVTSIPFVVGARGARSTETAEVLLEVYDVTGRRIVVLVNGRYRPGEYAVAWDGTTDSGNAASSGVYFARLVVDRSSFVRKMILLR